MIKQSPDSKTALNKCVYKRECIECNVSCSAATIVCSAKEFVETSGIKVKCMVKDCYRKTNRIYGNHNVVLQQTFYLSSSVFNISEMFRKIRIQSDS